MTARQIVLPGVEDTQALGRALGAPVSYTHLDVYKRQELGSVWNRLGSQVTILEGMPEFLAAADKEVAKVAAREFKKQNLDIKLGCKVTGTEVKKDGVHVAYTDDKGAAQELVLSLIHI